MNNTLHSTAIYSLLVQAVFRELKRYKMFNVDIIVPLTQGPESFKTS